MKEKMIIKGKRPEIYNTPGVDYLMHMVMVLAQELNVTRDRLDTLEALSEANKKVSQDNIDAYEPSQEILERREARRQNFMTNLFSVMNQEAGELAARDTKARFDKVIGDIATKD
jgi:hypothetical protein